MSFLIRLYILFSVALVAACLPSIIKHNQNLAAKAAENFTQLAFVDRNFSEASTLVTGSRSSDEVSTMTEKLDPSGKYPVSVVAASYESMPGKESMKIYLEGQGGDKSYHYLAVMEGTESKGYKVSAVARSEDPFPGSNDIKPLR